MRKSQFAFVADLLFGDKPKTKHKHVRTQPKLSAHLISKNVIYLNAYQNAIISCIMIIIDAPYLVRICQHGVN